MKFTRIVCSILFVVIVSSAVVCACEGEKLAEFATIAVDRCLQRNVTLGFDHGNRRQFVTLSNADGRKLYEALKPFYTEGAK